jgi:hypothetical protein
MELLIREIEPLLEALGSLDGNPRAVQVAPETERLIVQPFRFSQKFTWNKVKNLGILKKKKKLIDDMRIELRKKHNDGVDGLPDEKTDAGRKARIALDADWAEFLKTKEDFPGLLTMPVADLNLFDPKENPTGNLIPATILEAVSVLFDSIP